MSTFYMLGAPTVALAQGVRPALNLVDGLRRCGVDRDVSVPQICVVGDQSSGKSSVLEAICLVPLPRAAGLTTRCAIELHLSDGRISGATGDPASPLSDLDELAENCGSRLWTATISTSVDLTPVSISSPGELADAIIARTEALTGDRHSSGFSSERIIVRICAPDLPNLTLIDLPGIIRTKTVKYVSSDYGFLASGLLNLTQDILYGLPAIFSQYRGAVEQIRELIQSYMRQERTIILVVVPSTQDVATNEALEWASRFDPSGERTIGVMTKPDLIDEGAEPEIISVLTNNRKPLKLGYVMLRNRNQREVAEGISSADARRREADFFESSPVFSKIDKKLLGVEQLTSKLTSLLVARIYSSLPSMKNEIMRKLEKTEADLDEVGRGAGETEAEASLSLMRLVFEYHNLLQDACNGRYVDRKLWEPKMRVCTRAQSLYGDFKQETYTTRPDFDDSLVDEVAVEIQESRGRELPGFLNPRIFEARVARFVETWQSASTRLVSGVRKMLNEVTMDLFASIAPEFPALRFRVRELVSSAIGDLEERCRTEVQSIFARETEAFTMNDQFLEAVNKKRLERFDAAVLVALARVGRDSRSSREKEVATLLRSWYQEHYCAGNDERARADAEDMVVLLSVYWDVSSRRFIDSHVMAVEGTMIRPLAHAVHVPLNAMVLRVGDSSKGGGQESIRQLLQEDEATVEKRKVLRERLERLKKASQLVERY